MSDEIISENPSAYMSIFSLINSFKKSISFYLQNLLSKNLCQVLCGDTLVGIFIFRRKI